MTFIITSCHLKDISLVWPRMKLPHFGVKQIVSTRCEQFWLFLKYFFTPDSSHSMLANERPKKQA